VRLNFKNYNSEALFLELEKKVMELSKQGLTIQDVLNLSIGMINSYYQHTKDDRLMRAVDFIEVIIDSIDDVDETEGY
jgi:hypothetical protein